MCLSCYNLGSWKAVNSKAYLSIFVACHDNYMELHLLTTQEDYCVFILQREEVFGIRDGEKMSDEP